MGDINFIVLKINGVDVSGMPHCDAVQMFLKSSEPITLEVRRPKPNDLNKFIVSTAYIPPAVAPSISSSSSFPSLQSTSSMLPQDFTLSSSQSSPAVKNMSKNNIAKEVGYSWLLDDTTAIDSNSQVLDFVTRSPSSGSFGRKNFISTGIQTDAVITEYLFSDASMDDQSNENLFDDVLPPEIDIEEVTLQKAASNEKLGLTVSYSSGSDDTDTCTEVYISDIIPNSVAARDGRLRQGDQILQVNGRDVSSKEDTESLIAENKNAVTFLVSRYLYVENDIHTSFDEYDQELGQQTYQNCQSPQSVNYRNTDSLTGVVDVQCASEHNSNTSISSSSHKSCGDSAEANTAKDLKTKILKDSINYLNIDAHLESVNQELAQLTTRMENSMLLHSGMGSNVDRQEKVAKSGIAVPTTTIGKQLSNSQYLYRTPVDNVVKAANTATSVVLSMSDDATMGKASISTIDSKQTALIGSRRQIESDTEHIYETIPEDVESEPFYCLPYESMDRNLVEQWLEMQHYQQQLLQRQQQQHVGPETPTKIACSKGTKKEKSGLLLQQIKAIATSNKFQLPANSMKTVRSNSSGEDHENSSSAYNTGGSCNSNTNVGLELNSNEDGGAICDKVGFQSYRNNIALNISQASHVFLQQTQSCSGHGTDSFFQDVNDNCEECQRQKKDKFHSSPKHEQQPKSPQKLLNSAQRSLTTKQPALPIPTMSTHSSVYPRYTDPTNEKQQDISADTMYTNMANLKRTMILQQKLFRQALFRQNVPHTQPPNLTVANKITIPNERLHFTAPNLSQYHFVSSQEVSNAVIPKSTNFEEPTMVWKVKRRQDGTRYIVRRPIRNRILRERAMRLTTERNDHTTEDDTISEIKTGRYWTREERKKHIERSKERRLKQQQQQQAATQSKGEAIECPIPTSALSITTIAPTLMKKAPQVPLPCPQQTQIGILSNSTVATNVLPSSTSQNRVISTAPIASPVTQNMDASINKRSVKKKKKEENTSNNVGDTSSKIVGLLSVTTV